MKTKYSEKIATKNGKNSQAVEQVKFKVLLVKPFIDRDWLNPGLHHTKHTLALWNIPQTPPFTFTVSLSIKYGFAHFINSIEIWSHYSFNITYHILPLWTITAIIVVCDKTYKYICIYPYSLHRTFENLTIAFIKN